MIALLERIARKEYLVMACTIAIAFAVYRTTTCPTVSFTDSGELATVATTLGIAHPTGYPIWTLIGRLTTMIPMGSQPIVRLNMLAGILTALAVGFFFKLMLVLLRSQEVFRFKTGKIGQQGGIIYVACAFSTALIVGFSSTVWAQSVEIEVYALHLLLVTAATLFFVSGIEEQLDGTGATSGRLFLFAFILGLSFANHMTTILLAPGFLYLFFVSFGFGKRSWNIILLLSPFFLLGLSSYMYLPLRSAANPSMDWGHPATLERLWWHFTGKQYQSWMFAGWAVAKKQLTYFVTNFPTEFQWLLVAVLIYGLVETFRQSKRFATFVLVLFFTSLAYSINYDINEIDPYFIVAYLACGCMIGFGLFNIIRPVWNWRLGGSRTLAFVVLAGLPVVQIVNNRADVDQSRNYQAERFVQNIMSQLEPNAVVFSSLWDYFVSPSYYYQLVRNQRSDVTIIDRDLLQNRTWYFIQFAHQHPGILEKSQGPVNAFLAELNRYEQGEPFDYVTIKSRWDALLNDMIEHFIVDRPVYVDPRIAGEFPHNFEGIPQGLLIRLVRKGETVRWKPITAEFVPDTFDNYVTADLRRYFVAIYTFHALWLMQQGEKAEALRSLDKGLSIDPSFSPALRLKTQIPK